MHPTTRPVLRWLLPAVAMTAAMLSGSTAASGDVPERERPARCDVPSEQPGASSAKHTLEVDGRERSFVLRLPQGYEERDDWPLVVALHGRGSTGVEVEGYSELSSLPAVVAYPDGVADPDDGDRYRKAWQGAHYAVEGVDDVAFVEGLLDHLQSTTCVDERRAYLTGKSNGAGLAALVSCQLPERVAGVALVAPALYPGTQEGCDDAPAVPLLLVHGEADATIPYAGDSDRDLPDVREWLAARAERDDCRTTPRSGRVGRDVTTQQWTHCDAGSEVRHLAVAGGGHVWPGAQVYSGGGHVTQTIKTHQQVWTFFRKHELAAGGPEDQEETQ